MEHTQEVLTSSDLKHDLSIHSTALDSVIQENLLATNLITEKMLQEEQVLLKRAIEQETNLKEKKEALRLKEQEKSYNRLHLLLSRSSKFADFMAEKLKKDKSRETKKRKRSNIDKQLKDITQRNIVEDLEVKSKAGSKKKIKTEVGITDIYEDVNLRNQIINDIGVKNVDATTEKLIEQPKLLKGGTMRSYQLEGFDWLKTLFENGLNGILADEMGLGKTIQSIAVISYLIEMGVSGPFFVCCPLSTVPNWVAEIKRFTPDIPVVLYHGDINDRTKLRKSFLKETKVGNIFVRPIVVTSYSIALKDCSFLKCFEWKMLVVDEAQRIKNFQCKLIQALRSFSSVYRLLLTGTPLQNNLTELWTLLNFIIPELFDDLQIFEAWFDISDLTSRGATEEIVAKEQEKQIVSMMHQVLTPFLLRRTKVDVELSLPLKKELIIHATLTPLQQLYYSGVLNGNLRELLGINIKDDTADLPEKRKTKYTSHKPIASTSKATPFIDPSMYEINCKMGTVMMILRKICCHPYLVTYPIDPATNNYYVDENLVKHSGKLQLLDILLKELKQRGHKVLLFSQFVLMHEILEDYCYLRGYKFCRLVGDMKLEERQSEIDRFANDDGVFLFLISTRAGGLGLNLIAADTVIIYDSDWNPQSDLQAQDRCHRIGQTRPVVVYRLVVPKTIDERIIERATAKRKLEKAIINNGRFKSKYGPGNDPLSREDLKSLLDSPDFKELVKSECVMSREELDRILDRSDLMPAA